jgi:hypothetical protein
MMHGVQLGGIMSGLQEQSSPDIFMLPNLLPEI